MAIQRSMTPTVPFVVKQSAAVIEINAWIELSSKRRSRTSR
jgi:hypothetical protein